MTLMECYEQLGGDYAAIMQRLRTEERIKKFMMLFPRDTNYQTLKDCIASGDWDLAFRAAHSLKGVAMNLGFSSLAQTSSEITEALRNGKPASDPAPLLAAVTADYDRAMAAITAFQNSQ